MPDGNLAVRNVEVVRRYFAMLESDEPDADPSVFFAPDVEQIEWPNRLAPQGARRDLAGLREARARGRHAICNQRFAIENVVAVGDEVALEVAWSGQLLVSVGALNVGDHLRARFAVFIELRDGTIVKQRNYDCFEPF